MAVGLADGSQPPHLLQVIGPGPLSSSLVPGYLLDGVGMGRDAERKRDIMSRAVKEVSASEV